MHAGSSLHTPTAGPALEGLDPDTEERLQQIWKRAYSARTRADLVSLYRDWAATYDADHEAIGFFGHVKASRLMAKYVPFRDVAPILDAGAGTGAAGEVLRALGFANLTALDLSAEMLEFAERKGIYTNVVQADLGLPLDAFPASLFDGAILVGVFSYGQAPAHALNEIVRVVKPGGVIVFTMRTDFHESDAMGVRSRMDALERSGAWSPTEVTEPDLYLPKKDPDATFRVWCYRVLETKVPDAPDNFAEAVREAMTSDSRVRRLDHCHIWNTMASRLYDRYIEVPEYYLNDAEEEILRSNAEEIAGGEHVIVELGCGSARKVSHVLAAVLDGEDGTRRIRYLPIDLSEGALEATRAEIESEFDGRVSVDARRGHFDEVLPTITGDGGKVIFFFGGSIGNIETLEDTIDFLRAVRQRMTMRDRFVVGMDLDKDDSILRAAYEAGPRNFAFFANMLRRINNELGANLDIMKFRQESTYDPEAPHEGIRNHCVNLKLVTDRPQKVYISKLDLEVELRAGDAIQVGTSRKFEERDIEPLMAMAGLRLERQWFDGRHYMSLNECVRDDAAG